MRIIDLSVALKAGIASDPPSMLPKIEIPGPQARRAGFRGEFPGLKPEQLPDGEGAAMERSPSPPTTARISTRPSISPAPWTAASRRMKIDEVPLEWCFSAGVKLDFRDKPDGYVCKADDVEARARPHRLHAQAARHRAGEYRGRDGLRPAELHRQRLRHGPRGDALSDSSRACASPAPTAGAGTRRSHSPPSALLETGDASLIWEGHKAGREIGYCHMEKLDQSRAAAAVRLQGECFPVKIEKRFRRLDPLRRAARRLSKATRDATHSTQPAPDRRPMDQFSFGARDNGIIQIAYTVADIRKGHAPVHRASSRRAVVFGRPVRAAEGALSRRRHQDAGQPGARLQRRDSRSN